MLTQKQKLSPSFDPWEPYTDYIRYGKHTLTNVEFTTTTLCNMRCEHCAVGYTLQTKEPNGLPLSLLLQRLEEIPTLQCISITGGEPMLSLASVKQYVLPLLKYAHERGIYTQLNSNLTLELHRYEMIAPYLDVLHISHNWGTVDEFVDGAFAQMERKPTYTQRAMLFERIIQNSKILTEMGVMISAETMLNKRTLPHLKTIYHQIVDEMGCQRWEVHPMYPSDFGENLEILTKDEIREAIHQLLDIRHDDIWTLFGTLPFYACSDDTRDIALIQRLQQTKNVTIRNDPDGRSRLNVNIFSGDIIVTDFGNLPPLGNIKTHTLEEAFTNWHHSSLAYTLNCHCPSAKCLGPNILVKNSYYKDIDFQQKKAGYPLPNGVK